MEPEAINWYRSPTEKSALRQLTQKSDLMGWLQAGSFLTIYLSLTALAFCMFLMRLWVIMVIVCYLQSVFMSFVSMGAAVHELSHGTPFRSKGPNEFFLYVFSFLTLNNPIHLRASHIQNHHPFTVHRGRDKEVIQGPVKEKLNWVNMVSWVTFDFRWFAVCIRANVLHALGRSGADFFYWDPLFREDDPRRKQMCRWARFMVVSYILFLAVFLVLHLWVLVYLVVFSCFFGRIVANLLTATQHTGLGENIPDWRAVCHTVTVEPGCWLSVLAHELSHRASHVCRRAVLQSEEASCCTWTGHAASSPWPLRLPAIAVRRQEPAAGGPGLRSPASVPDNRGAGQTEIERRHHTQFPDDAIPMRATFLNPILDVVSMRYALGLLERESLNEKDQRMTLERRSAIHGRGDSLPGGIRLCQKHSFHGALRNPG